ncbi:SDR family NAD(P)-dependent oxidoreductase [Paeniglutamicibacter antarcticus]|uniref:SDR family NAD(P)-dependent oxidoreductase n=1 Tax=Arthrobacter terrae TaxID=2935737 RepID=A0A931G566_9MICC|nr:oxidoreductase [Arthrobacter terrae]MBG0739210.1 SDR family NAD(P)-dependent oxidoreductase [Arthrobacter terrae]
MNGFRAESMPDQTGRHVVITGANSGLGFQASLAFAAKGARVTLACRNPERGEAALAQLRETTGSTQCDVRPLDLGSLKSIRAFAADWSGPLDVLINNAGLMATARATTADGFEQQLGINHLGHFALSGLLLPALRTATAARVVVVSSLAHKRGAIDFDDLMSQSRYRRWRAYSQSKIANLYFAMEFGRRLQAHDDRVVVAAAHPGLANTNLPASMGRNSMGIATGVFMRLMAQPGQWGVLPVLYAAAAADVTNGDFYGPNGPGETRGEVTMVAPAARVADLLVARRLWDASEQLTGVAFADLPPV